LTEMDAVGVGVAVGLFLFPEESERPHALKNIKRTTETESKCKRRIIDTPFVLRRYESPTRTARSPNTSRRIHRNLTVQSLSELDGADRITVRTQSITGGYT